MKHFCAYPLRFVPYLVKNRLDFLYIVFSIIVEVLNKFKKKSRKFLKLIYFIINILRERFCASLMNTQVLIYINFNTIIKKS